MTSSVFPDLNVWLSLTLLTHQHHARAWDWYQAISPGEDLCFCRQTQLGFLRLVTTEAVAKEGTLTQLEAWAAYDLWVEQGGAVLRTELVGLDTKFRATSKGIHPAPKTWADAYLAAFAETAGLRLVTFDKALAAKAKGSIMLRP